MPEEYLECVKSYIEKGVSERTAKARCAAAYYKRHGKTVMEDHAAGSVPEEVLSADNDLVKLIMMDLDAVSQYSAAFSTSKTGRPKKDEIKLLHGTRISYINTDILEEFNVIEVVAARVGSVGFTTDGRAVSWTKAALEDAQSTWLFGRISANHNSKDYGKIIDSFLVGDDLHQLAKVDDEMKDWIKKSREIVGVSTEAKHVFVNSENNIIKATGSGLTFVFPPDIPMCTPEEGCVVIMATEKKEEDVEENGRPEGTERTGPDVSGTTISGTAETGVSSTLHIPSNFVTYITTDDTTAGGWNTIYPTWTEPVDWSKYTVVVRPISVSPDNINEKASEPVISGNDEGENMAEDKKEETVCAKVHSKVLAEKDELSKQLEAQTKELDSLRATVAKINDAKRAEMFEVMKAENIDVELFKDEPLMVIEKTIQAVRMFKKAQDALEVVDSGATVTATKQENVPSGDAVSQAMNEADMEKVRIAEELAEVERIEKKAQDMGY